MAMNSISKTALTTFMCHVLDAQSSKPILEDLESISMFNTLQKINPDILLPRRPSNQLITHIALRAKKYDDVAREFISRHPDGTVLNVGGGFDNRFSRIDNGRMRFIEIDLPDVLDIKAGLVDANHRYIMCAQSVFDYTWIEQLPPEPVLLLAEGVFMYCDEKDIRNLFVNLMNATSQLEIFAEVFNSSWLSGWRKNLIELKLKKQLGFAEDARFTFGLKSYDEMESWDPRMKFIGEWSYLDSNHPKLGVLRMYRKINLFRLMQYSVHYKSQDTN